MKRNKAVSESKSSKKHCCVLQKFLILIVMAFSIPVFAQNIEPNDSLSQLWNSMTEEEKSAIVKSFFNSKIQSEMSLPMKIYNEEQYFQGKRRLKKGLIFTGAGVTAASLPFLFLLSNDLDDALVGMVITGIPLWSVGGGFILAGIPITIVGASQMLKYKPQMAIAPNGIKFTMEF